MTRFRHGGPAVSHAGPDAGPSRRAGRPGLTRRELCAGALALGGAGALAALAGCGAPAGTDAASSSAAASSASGSTRGASSASSSASAGAGASAAGDAGAGATLSSRVLFVFDTMVSLRGYDMPDGLLDEIEQECDRYDALFSAQTDDSDVARINAAGGSPVEVDPDTAALIARSLEVCDLFDGAFDITIGAVSLLWDFQAGVKPADDAIQAALPHIDYHKVHVDGTTVTLEDPDARLDLGGIAKGWIADRIRQRMVDAGVTSGMIDLGSSSIYVLGDKPDGSPWRIGLRDPSNPTGGTLGVVEAGDRAVATSGLYDQHFEQDGVDYYHILDPRTGYPVKTDMTALTAILDDSTVGDGMSTAFFVKGTQGSLDWIAAHEDEHVQAVFIAPDDSLTFTSGFQDTYDFEDQRTSALASSATDSASADGK